MSDKLSNSLNKLEALVLSTTSRTTADGDDASVVKKFPRRLALAQSELCQAVRLGEAGSWSLLADRQRLQAAALFVLTGTRDTAKHRLAESRKSVEEPGSGPGVDGGGM